MALTFGSAIIKAGTLRHALLSGTFRAVKFENQTYQF